MYRHMNGRHHQRPARRARHGMICEAPAFGGFGKTPSMGLSMTVVVAIADAHGDSKNGEREDLMH